MTLEDKVKQLVAESLHRNENEVTLEAEFINDLQADSLDIAELVMAIEDAFNAVNPVTITYREIKNGDLILIARRAGEGTDFLDILAIHNGYEVEFVLSPSPEAGTQALTETQVGMCIDAIDTLAFVVPVKEPAAPSPTPRVVRQRIVVK